MSLPNRPPPIRSLFEMGTEIPDVPVRTQAIENRKGEAKHVVKRLAAIVEEPSNILFTTTTGPDTTRYDAMEPAFWIECLELMKKTYCP